MSFLKDSSAFSNSKQTENILRIVITKHEQIYLRWTLVTCKTVLPWLRLAEVLASPETFLLAVAVECLGVWTSEPASKESKSS